MDARALSRFRNNRAALVGGAIVLALVLFALFAPLMTGQDPDHSDFAFGRTPLGAPAASNAHHLLGTDTLFRDQLSRLAHGARLSLEIGFSASVIALVIGALVGIVSGYYADKPLGPLRVSVDDVLMRFVDILLSFPFLLLVMAIGAAIDRSTVTTIFLILGLTGWLGTARIVRAKTIQVRDLDYVVASRALGQSTPRILFRHILPSVGGTLIVLGTVSVAQMILAESVLSYLNVGVQPPTATWGRMLWESTEYYVADPRLVAAPGLAILLSVLGFNLLGEGLRDAFDPREP